ncbi:MAG: hypothetical protein R2851_08415 [Caldilineaceae bacterium]
MLVKTPAIRDVAGRRTRHAEAAHFITDVVRVAIVPVTGHRQSTVDVDRPVTYRVPLMIK